MIAKINITEGCVCYSYEINDIEWVELTSKYSKDYNPKLVNVVFDSLVTELSKQYDLPDFLISKIYEDDVLDDDIPCFQDTFINLVKANKNTIEKYEGSCDECGDIIYSYDLTLEVKDPNSYMLPTEFHKKIYDYEK